MHLNVKLKTPPAQCGVPSADTPKTPEILNSLISLSSCSSISSLSTSSGEYHKNNSESRLPTSMSGSIDLKDASTLSSISTTLNTSRGEIPTSTSVPDFEFDRRFCCHQGSNTPQGSSLQSSIDGCASTPIPHLVSPISTVKATKSALIKEGLKHQIKSKLNAAGVKHYGVSEGRKIIKEELTPEDEERRFRRRERNKVAATKCRNKKKERTVVLISESQVVENQNIRLKNEIQKLTDEKRRLERVLDAPDHVFTCAYKLSSENHRTLFDCCSSSSSSTSKLTNTEEVSPVRITKEVKHSYVKRTVTRSQVVGSPSDDCVNFPKSTNRIWPSSICDSSATFTQNSSDIPHVTGTSSMFSRSLPSLNLPNICTEFKDPECILQPVSEPSSILLSPISRFSNETQGCSADICTPSSSVLLSPESPTNRFQHYEDEEYIRPGSCTSSYRSSGFSFSPDAKGATEMYSGNAFPSPSESFMLQDARIEPLDNYANTKICMTPTETLDNKYSPQSNYLSYEPNIFSSSTIDYSKSEYFRGSSFMEQELNVNNESYSDLTCDVMQTGGKYLLDISTHDPIYTPY